MPHASANIAATAPHPGLPGTIYATAGVAGSIAAASPGGGEGPYALTLTGNPGGVLSGSPSTGLAHDALAAGTYGPFTVSIADARDRQGSQNFTLSVLAPLAIANYPTATGQGNVSGTIPAQAVTGGLAPYTYELASPIAGISINHVSGLITFTKNGGTYPITVRVRDSRNAEVLSNTFDLVVSQAYVLTYTLDNAIRVNQTSTWTPATVGGIGPFTYAIKTGAHPLGMNFNASTGVITGQPTQSGNGSFSIEVTDAGRGDAKVTSPVIAWTSTSIDDSETWAKVSGVTVSGLSNGSGTGATNKAYLSDNNFAVFNYPVGHAYDGRRFGSVSTHVGTVTTTISFTEDVTLEGMIEGMIVRMRYTIGGGGTTGMPGNIILTLRNAANATIGTINHEIVGGSTSAQAFTNIPINASGIRSIVMSTTSAGTDVTFSEIEWMQP